MRITPSLTETIVPSCCELHYNIELSNALLDQFADFGGIQLHAPVPLRLQDVCKALTDRVRAINDHHPLDDNACHYRLIDFAIQLNFA